MAIDQLLMSSEHRGGMAWCRPEGETVNGRARGPPKASHFTFDGVHGPQASQQAVFRDAESIVTSVLDGYRYLPLSGGSPAIFAVHPCCCFYAKPFSAGGQ